MRSSLANWAPAKRKRWRRMKPWGLLVHTSGRGIVERAKRKGVPPIVLALDWYRARAQSGVHYVIGHDGTIYQMLEDTIRGAHVGISAKERRSYLSGRWSAEVHEAARDLWRARWPGYRSPQALYPTRSPNGCYIGVEMVPLDAQDVGSDGLWFTSAQHRAVGLLYRDLEERHGWQATDFLLSARNCPRFLGHEDVDAFARWDKRGGWDPGAMRDGPRFSWAMARAVAAGA